MITNRVRRGSIISPIKKIGVGIKITRKYLERIFIASFSLFSLSSFVFSYVEKEKDR